MNIEYLGANCLKITTKKATAFVDPAVPGIKVDTGKANFSMLTNTKLSSYKGSEFIIDIPGEYEISGLSIKGVATRSHMDEPGKQSATMFKIIHDNFSLLVVGHIFSKLSDEQLESLGVIDIIVVPVGGNGYTIDSVGATQLVRKIESKIVIPTHYEDKNIKYEVPQAELKPFLDDMGSQPEELEVLKLSSNTILPEQQKVVVLRRM